MRSLNEFTRHLVDDLGRELRLRCPAHPEEGTGDISIGTLRSAMPEACKLPLFCGGMGRGQTTCLFLAPPTFLTPSVGKKKKFILPSNSCLMKMCVRLRRC